MDMMFVGLMSIIFWRCAVEDIFKDIYVFDCL